MSVDADDDGSDRPDALVTVIVAGYNIAPYATEALDSLRAQTLTRWRAILVDDASTDATHRIFAEAAAQDPRFVVLTQPRWLGLAAARNAGLELVNTPFLGFLDADDVMAEGALERTASTLERTGSDFVAGAYVRLRPDGVGYTAGTVQPWVAAATDPERSATTIEAHPEASGNVVAWSKVSRTDFWRRTNLRFPEGRLYEDQAVAQAMYTRARTFDVIPDVVVQWRVRADGSSITQRESDLAVLAEALDAMSAGLAVLSEASATRAVQARAGLILTMDVPRLAAIAREHPDDSYRRALGTFTRDIWVAADGATRAALDPDAATTVAAVSLW